MHSRKKTSENSGAKAVSALQAVVREMSRMPGVTQAKFFGFEGFKIKDKFFAFTFKGRLVIKLHRERVVALVTEGKGRQFNPYGRIKKEWVSIESAGDNWLGLIQEAKDFVASHKK